MPTPTPASSSSRPGRRASYAEPHRLDGALRTGVAVLAEQPQRHPAQAAAAEVAGRTGRHPDEAVPEQLCRRRVAEPEARDAGMGARAHQPSPDAVADVAVVDDLQPAG